MGLNNRACVIRLVGCGLIFSTLFPLPLLAQSTFSKSIQQRFRYPDARRDESIVEDHFGTKVADPYHWLEDPDSEETQQFVDAQNNLTRPYLENNELWHQINKNLTKLWNYPKYTLPERHGEYYFSFQNSGLQNQAVFFKQKTLESELIEFLNPNKFSDDGTVALSRYEFSEDGNLLAYGLSESGSDWIKIKFLDVQTGKDFPEVLSNVKFSTMSWTHDNKGIFYARYPRDEVPDGHETEINENQKLYYHRIGESPDEDMLVVEFTDNPKWSISSSISECGKYLILTIVEGTSDNLVYFADLDSAGEIREKLKITPIVTEFEADYEYVTSVGSKVIFRTNKNAPNYRLISIDLKNPIEENWTTLLPEDKRDVLQWARCVDKNKLVVSYLHDVKSLLQVHDLGTGKLLRTFSLGIGEIEEFSGDKKYSEMFYKFVSFLTPGTIYRFDFATPKVEPTILREETVQLDGFDKNNFLVEQVFYPSRDGTKIPMFIVQKKTTSAIQRAKPCLLRGYGGFNINIVPSFSVKFVMFLHAFDGVLAVPNIRGGGEYGEKWHDGGRLLNKQNVFDDFHAAAEYLVTKNYTEHKKIAIQGGSNGGLLIGACINQRPELFGAAIAEVGVMDMLRFHKFTIGYGWISEYGNPDEKIHFENLVKYSPIHNVRSPSSSVAQYPAILITTGDHDDRVSPLHSLKFAATLHHAVKDNQFQTNPILLRVYSKAGHGAGKPTTKKIEEATDILTFIHTSLK